MKLRRRAAPLPVPVVPIPSSLGGALIAYCDDAGRVLAYGPYWGDWELNNGFRNLTRCVIYGIAKGTATRCACADTARREVVSAGTVAPYPVEPGASIIFRPGDISLSVTPKGHADDLFASVLALGAGGQP